MRNHENHILATRDEAISGLLARCDFKRETETVPLAQAPGRTLAADAFALHDLPNKPTSNMDAVAVCFDDFADGMPDVTAWERGNQFQFCNTGVAMPDGYDTAIAIECWEVGEGDKLLSLDHVPERRGESVSPVGANMERGELLVEANTLLSPTHVALLAQGGHTQVDVVKRPRVAFIPTGNELVPACAEVPAGKNVECNSYIAAGMLEAWGADAHVSPIILDDRAQLLEALTKAARECDIVVINAGSSKGSDDWTCEILEEYGDILFHETDNAPGRHCSGAFLEGTPVVGISGPPMGAEFTIEWFVKPLVDVFLRGRIDKPPVLFARLDEPMGRRGPARMNVVKRVSLYRDERGYLWAHVLPTTAPVLRECAKANAFFVMPKDSTSFERGDVIEVELRFPYSVLGV